MMSTSLITKSGQDDHLDLVFRALGDRTRRTILSRLAEGPAMVSELAAPFQMSLPAVGKHLRVLERAGLVKREIDGRIHRCSLSPHPLQDAEQWLEQYRHFWDETLSALVQHFETSSDRN